MGIAARPRQRIFVSTNYFFVSSPLHLLFSSNIALCHEGDDNIVVLMPRESRQFSPFAEVLSKDTSIFSDVISFETGNRSSKHAERKRRMAVIQDALSNKRPDRIFTGTDRRVEFQYAMSVGSGINPELVGIYVDDGMATYLGHKSMHNIAHRYLDPLAKKLLYGWWWKNPITIGSSGWIDEMRVAYPELVHESLRSKKVLPIDREVFKDPRFIALCERLLQFRNVDDCGVRDIDVIVVLTHESFYPDADTHLQGLIDGVAQHDSSAKIAVKPHPRSEKTDFWRDKYPDVLFLDSKVSMELFLPLVKQHCVIIGDISSALFTANWFGENRHIIAITLAHGVPSHIEDNLAQLFLKLDIPKIGIDELPALLANLKH